MCDGRLFAQQIASIERYRPVMVADLSRDETIEAIAARLLAAAPPRFYLAGLSMGGIVALEVFRQDRTRVAGLALLDTTPLADAPEKRPVREDQIARVRAGALAQVMAEEMKPAYLAAPARCNAALLLEIRLMAEALGPVVFERQSRALMARRDNRDLLPAIACPTEVVCGEDDTLCPPQLHSDMAARIRGARLTILPACGHLSSMERPAEVTGILERGLLNAETSLKENFAHAH